MNPVHDRRSLMAAFRDDAGAALVELAIVIPIFLLLFLGLIDFGRLYLELVLTEKALDKAAHLAILRPAACPGVPDFNLRGTVPAGTVAPRYGTACGSGATVCANPGTITCSGSASNATAAEIWPAIQGLMPAGSTVANLRFSYSFDQNLGFLGGPYVPVVTVEIQNRNFTFVMPLTQLAALAGASGNQQISAGMPFPALSVSLPGEDLNSGGAG